MTDSVSKAADPDETRPVSWKLLAPNIANDQKNIWLLPFHKTERNRWVPFLIVGGVTAGLFAVDATEARYFRKSHDFVTFDRIFNGTATEAGTVAVPAAMYGYGLLDGDSHLKGTAMLAGEAALDTEVVTIVMKDLTRRRGPAAVTGGDYSGAWLSSSGSYWLGKGSFPSGHTASAFSVATVLARRYKQHKWVPYAVYGAASLVGFSRLTLSAHYASDVFLGAAMGYTISRFAVLHGE